MKLPEIPGRTIGLILILSSLLISVTMVLCDVYDHASHTMQPDCRDANVPYTMQRDPAHEAPREYPEPPR